MSPLRLALSLVVSCTTTSLTALADDADCPAGRPWVALSFQGDFPSGFERSVSQDLTAGLAVRGIRVCPRAAAETAGSAPLADIRLTAEPAERVDVSVEVRDAITQKRVGRDLDLRRVPADGRAFSVALAADELLQASWVELALERGKRAEVRPPPEVQRTVESALRAGRSLPPVRLGARAAGEHFGGGQVHLGADATLEAPFTPWLRLGLAFGARQGNAVESERGRVASSAFGAEARLELVYYRRPRFDAFVAAGVRGSRVQFEGKAAPGSLDSNYDDFSLFLRGGPGAALGVAGPVWVNASAAVGAPLRAVEAVDDGATATGASGLELSLGIGLAVEL